MARNVSPSEIACQALASAGMDIPSLYEGKRSLSPAKQDGVCRFCGITVSKGDAVSTDPLPETFNDRLSLALAGSPFVCRHCMPLTTKKGLNAIGGFAFSLTALYPFRKFAERAALLLEPPEPPFAFCFSTAKKPQHVIWRTPVSHSRDLFFIRAGHAVFTIRRQLVKETVEQCARFADEALQAGMIKKTYSFPFVNTGFVAKDPLEDSLRLHFLAEERGWNLLSTLTPGEEWAVAVIMAAKTICEPAVITDIDAFKSNK